MMIWSKVNVIVVADQSSSGLQNVLLKRENRFGSCTNFVLSNFIITKTSIEICVCYYHHVKLESLYNDTLAPAIITNLNT